MSKCPRWTATITSIDSDRKRATAAHKNFDRLEMLNKNRVKYMKKPAYVSDKLITDEEWLKVNRRTRLLFIARSQVDLKVREHGNNAGKEVEEYQKSVRLKKGQPWCTAFIYWCALEAGYLKHELPDHPQSAYGWYQWAKAKGLLVPLTDGPKRGDIGVYADKKPGKDWQGHGFAIAGYAGMSISVLRTLEGNTDLTGDREGDGVYEQRRSVDSIVHHTIHAFIRLAD